MPLIRGSFSLFSLSLLADQFRNRIVETEKEVILLREENQRLRAGWDGEKRRIRDLENRLVNAEAANSTLQRKVDAFCEQKVVLENEVRPAPCVVFVHFFCCCGFRRNMQQQSYFFL